MPFREFLERRNNYAYPAVALQGTYINPAPSIFGSTMAMDQYIHDLLISDHAEEKVLGYLSVVFWGFYSGQDGIIRQERAMGKVGLARDGRDRLVRGQPQRMRGVVDRSVEWIAAQISEATNYIATDNYSEALRILNQLPQLQIAFSSKVCAFIDPCKCGVLDSVIVERNPDLHIATDANGIILNRAANRQRYNDYCVFLQAQAAEINSHAARFRWTDRDNQQYPWRALDVERAMY